MGQIILSNVKLWVGKHDMSGRLNAIALNDTPDVLDNTTFGATAKSRKKGLPVVTADLEGFFDAPIPDSYFSVLDLFHITGTATGGGTTSLIDTTKNFIDEGIVPGASVINITDNGNTQAAGVTSITTTTNPYDTLNFAALTGGASFVGGGDSYKVVVAGIPMSIAPEPTVGGPAYFFKSQNIEYSWGGTVGELAKFSVKTESVGQKMIRGWILENGAIARTANGNTTTGLELGGVGAAQYLYGVIHVLSTADTANDKLDVIIQSDTVATFDDDPTTRITFAQVSGVGGGTYEWAVPIAGAIAHTFWRAKWTVTDVDDPSFTFAVLMGIAT